MRVIGRVILYFFAILGLLSVAAVVVGAYLIAEFKPERPEAPEKIVLAIDVERGIVERREGALSRGLGGPSPLVLRDVVDAIDAAAADSRVAGLVLFVGESPLDIAHAQTLRGAVARFREAGKTAYSFAEGFGDLGNGTVPYYLASAADSVWLQPSGTVGLIGIAIETPFAAGALDKLDIEARYDQRHEYKGAGEIFVRRGFSEEARRTLQGLVDSWMLQVIRDISLDRKITEPDLRRLIDSGPLLATEAAAAKLVDALGYRDVFEDRVDDAVGRDAEWLPVESYLAIARRPHSSGPHVALIQGTGPIVSGEEKEGPFGSPDRIGSDTMADAIAVAAADSRIQAILLRIDSPGGSYVASDSVWRAIRRARAGGKPVIASLGQTAASGGYYIAMAADRIVAEPATVTGSIGVFALKFVTREFWRSLGIEWDRVQSGEHAAMWSPVGDYPAGAHERVNAILDSIYADFAGKVAEARGLSETQLDAVARGRVWSGLDARRNGLVDELGGLPVAVAAVKAALRLPPEASVTLVELPEPSRFDQLLDMLRRQGFEAGAMVAGWRSLMTGVWPFADPTVRQATERLRALAQPAGVLQMPPIRLAQ